MHGSAFKPLGAELWLIIYKLHISFIVKHSKLQKYLIKANIRWVFIMWQAPEIQLLFSFLNSGNVRTKEVI